MLGRWVSDSGDSKLAKAEVKAAAGEQPVALGPSETIMPQATPLLPTALLQNSAQVCSSRALFLSRHQQPLPFCASPHKLPDVPKPFSSKNTATFSEDPGWHNPPWGPAELPNSQDTWVLPQGPHDTEKQHLCSPRFSEDSVSCPPSPPSLVKIPSNKWQQ